MTDILDDLLDLHKQATTERSHYYVASCTVRAIAEINNLRTALLRIAALGEKNVPKYAQEIARAALYIHEREGK